MGSPSSKDENRESGVTIEARKTIAVMRLFTTL